MYTKIVLSGGAAKGLAYIGVLEYLEKTKILNNINEYIGCSIGAFTSLLFLLGYDSKTLKDVFNNYNLSDLKHLRISNFFDDYGLDNGKKVSTFIKIFLKTKKVDEEITLLELYKKFGKTLVTVVTNVNTKQTEYISYDIFPDMPVYLAVQMSMCIPFIYTPIKYNNQYYVDGGLTCNFPVRYVKETSPDDKALCFVFEEEKNTEIITTFDDYLYNVLKSSFCQIETMDKEYALQLKYDIIVLNVNMKTSFNLEISNEKKDELYKCGYRNIKKFLNSKSNKKNE